MWKQVGWAEGTPPLTLPALQGLSCVRAGQPCFRSAFFQELCLIRVLPRGGGQKHSWSVAAVAHSGEVSRVPA